MTRHVKSSAILAETMDRSILENVPVWMWKCVGVSSLRMATSLSWNNDSRSSPRRVDTVSPDAVAAVEVSQEDERSR